MIKRMERYFKKHPHQNAVAHFLIGAGLGILMARPVFGIHPVRWGIVLLTVGVALHLYPLRNQKNK
jgi:predicted regulator of amino acid metabolism with ACT domain